MTATAARIGFIQQDFRRVVATTANPTTRYGNLARISEDPIETFFDDIADAEAVAVERQLLLSVDRRRFRVSVVGLDELLALTYSSELPVAGYTDSQRDFSDPTLLASMIMDFDKQKAAVVLWG